eukprot:PhF_6_TR35422/c0_g1_i1/m.51591
MQNSSVTTTTNTGTIPTPSTTPHTSLHPSLKQGIGILNRITSQNYSANYTTLVGTVLPALTCSSPDVLAKFVDVFVQKGASDELYTETYVRLVKDLMSTPFRDSVVVPIRNQLRVLLQTHRTIPHTVFFAHMYVAQAIKDDEGVAFVSSLLQSTETHDVQRLCCFLNVARIHLENKSPALAIRIVGELKARLNTDLKDNPLMQALVRRHLDQSEITTHAQVLSSCTSLSERRVAALVLLNVALQGTGNSSYASCRRSVDKFCTANRLDLEDQKLLHTYLSEYMLAGNTFTKLTEPEAPSAPPPPPASNTLEHINITDRVRVSRVRGEENFGMVKFIGTPHFTNKGPEYAGVWLGVALDHPKGNHDGVVDGVRYFWTAKRHGIFVRPENVTLLEDTYSEPAFMYPQDKTGTLLRFDIRPQSTKKYLGLVHGDRIASGEGTGGAQGTIVGTRYGVLFWVMDGADGASPCRDTMEEVLHTLKKKKYKAVGNVPLKNYFVSTTTTTPAALDQSVPDNDSTDPFSYNSPRRSSEPQQQRHATPPAVIVSDPTMSCAPPTPPQPKKKKSAVSKLLSLIGARRTPTPPIPSTTTTTTTTSNKKHTNNNNINNPNNTSGDGTPGNTTNSNPGTDSRSSTPCSSVVSGKGQQQHQRQPGGGVERVRHLVPDDTEPTGVLASPSLASYYSSRSRTPRTPSSVTSSIHHRTVSEDFNFVTNPQQV